MEKTRIEESLRVLLYVAPDIKIPLDNAEVRGLAARLIELDVGARAVEERLEELAKHFAEKGYDASELCALVDKAVYLERDMVEEEVWVTMYPCAHPQARDIRYVARRRVEYAHSSYSKERNEAGSKLQQLVKSYFELIDAVRSALQASSEEKESEDDEEDDY